MKIALLGCDDAPEQLRHLGGTYREMFERLLTPHIPDAEFRWYDVVKGDLPDSADAADAYVCTGSRFSVYDDAQWIGKLKAFVRKLNDEEKPFVGICFGHQVLAEALGGSVKPAPQGWGVGVHDMAVVKPEPWMEPQQDHARIQYMHGDQVMKLPPGSEVLARAGHCEVAMFRVGENMLGIEGHPEFPAPYVEALIRARRERIGEAVADAALAHVNDETDANVVARWIRNFIEHGKKKK